MKLERLNKPIYTHDNLGEHTFHFYLMQQIANALFYDLLTYFCHASSVPKLRGVIDEYFSENARSHI
jgi:hypothetical protein